jgi:hypothetical protein
VEAAGSDLVGSSPIGPAQVVDQALNGFAARRATGFKVEAARGRRLRAR